MAAAKHTGAAVTGLAKPAPGLPDRRLAAMPAGGCRLLAAAASTASTSTSTTLRVDDHLRR